MTSVGRRGAEGSWAAVVAASLAAAVVAIAPPLSYILCIRTRSFASFQTNKKSKGWLPKRPFYTLGAG